MTLRFKPEDFKSYKCDHGDNFINDHQKQWLANHAQQIFDEWLKREGKFISSANDLYEAATKKWCEQIFRNIKECDHPKEKINIQPMANINIKENIVGAWFCTYTCECGAKVRPKEFEEIK